MRRASEIQGWMTTAELRWLKLQGQQATRIVEVFLHGDRCYGSAACSAGHDHHYDCLGVMEAVGELLPNAVIGPDSIWSVRV